MNTTTRSILITIFALICSLVTALGLPILEKKGFLLVSFYEKTSDWRTLFFSDHIEGQHDDIVVILVNEDSLYKYPSRSPVDRVLLAKLVKVVDDAGASVIGLDFIFDRPTYSDKDDQLIKAIKTAKTPVIIGSIDKRSHLVRKDALDYQSRFIKDTGRPSGHIYFIKSENFLDFGDGVIRRTVPVISQTPGTPSFANMLASYDRRKIDRPSGYIAWLRSTGAGSRNPFITFEVPEHKPEEANGNMEKIFPSSWRSALKGKIVLIGGDFVDRDRHYTPLSIYNRVRIPGVMVHAHIAAQLRDNRFIKEPSLKLEMIGIFTLTLIGFLLGWIYQLGRFDILVGLLGLTVLTVIGVLAFWWFKFLVPSSFLIAWALGGTLGHFSGTRLLKNKMEAGQ